MEENTKPSWAGALEVGDLTFYEAQRALWHAQVKAGHERQREAERAEARQVADKRKPIVKALKDAGLEVAPLTEDPNHWRHNRKVSIPKQETEDGLPLRATPEQLAVIRGLSGVEVVRRDRFEPIRKWVDGEIRTEGQRMRTNYYIRQR